ncbi:MAG: M23 family metallopeptidase, partial [Beijerinckiaceae bacterium]
FGDRSSQKLITQTSEMQDAYEQRLQAYRAEIARLSLEVEQSKFDQNSVEGRVVEIGRKQRQIELRLQALRRLSEIVNAGAAATTAPEQPGARRPGAPPATGTPASRISFETADEPPAFHGLIHPIQADAAPDIDAAEVPTEIDLFVQRMEKSLQTAEQTQLAVLTAFARNSDQRAQRFRQALGMLGISQDHAMQMRGKNDIILPHIVLPISELQSPFGERLTQIRNNFALMFSMRGVIEMLPVNNPTSNEVRYSSGFGYRIHPIHNTRRLHAGIDMAAPVGTTIHAAGSGVIASAGWGGGYGNLIQIDHGNGILTRYAHLSQIDVTAGQPVSRGMLIGRMGSTGASTGSHLHFETRLRGQPVNPACFLQAGDRIYGRLTVPLACDDPIVWQRPAQNEDEDDDS